MGAREQGERTKRDELRTVKHQKTADPLTVKCPRCDAGVRAGCMSPATGRGVRPHRARQQLANTVRAAIQGATLKPDAATPAEPITAEAIPLPSHERETDRAERIAKELGVENSVALDIGYLRDLEVRIIEAARRHPELREFPVSNVSLETFLDALEEQ